MLDTTELRVAVLGVGLMGSYHAEVLSTRTRGCRLTVINDVAMDRAERIANGIGARAMIDPIEAIGADDVDAVIIATPGAAHEKQVLACLERGIPVLCEKPLTTDPDSAYQIVAAEQALGRTLIQVGFMRRFDPEYQQLRELIAAGELGNPLMVHCAHRNPDVPAGFDSQMAITDSVVHEVDVIRYLLDEEIAAVSVLTPTATGRAPAAVHDPMLVVFETVSGRVADVEVFVRTGVGYEVRTEVVGEQGAAMIGIGTGLQRTTTDGRRGGRLAPGFQRRFATAYEHELQAWVDAARQGTIAGPGSWDGYAALAVCGAGVEAIRSGRRVEVQLAQRP